MTLSDRFFWMLSTPAGTAGVFVAAGISFYWIGVVGPFGEESRFAFSDLWLNVKRLALYTLALGSTLSALLSMMTWARALGIWWRGKGGPSGGASGGGGRGPGGPPTDPDLPDLPPATLYEKELLEWNESCREAAKENSESISL